MLTRLTARSLWDRRMAVGLTVAGIALSTALILGVERVRVETRESFTSTISGTDLIVGARTSPVQLLLYSVFRIGDATNNLDWTSFEKISRHPRIDWAIPIALGDSHRGYRVVGTTDAYFQHFRYSRDQSLTFAEGKGFQDVFDAVLGAQVAQALGYEVGDAIVVAHGARDDGLSLHDDLPFKVSGILRPTGTPVDRAVHVTLKGVTAIHVGWESGTRIGARTLDREHVRELDLQLESITAFFLGLKRRMDVFQIQRAINEFPDEPLLAILPGVALSELWSLFSLAELALLAVAAMTLVTGLLGMVVGIFSTLNERRREMAVMRSVGARPLDIAVLLVAESSLIGVLGAVMGYMVLSLAVAVANPMVAAASGLHFSLGLPGSREALLLGVIVAAACLTGILPAWRAYRMSVHDGLNAGA